MDDDDNENDGEAVRSFASPACLMHEVDPAYLELTAASDPHTDCNAPQGDPSPGAAALHDKLSAPPAG